MKTKIKSFIFSTAILSGVFLLASFSKNDVNEIQSLAAFTPATGVSASGNGISSAIPAYYDAKLFNIIFVEFPPQAEKSLIAHNPGINFIYQSDPGLPGGQPFISVIDAVPGDGMNPVWEEVQIAFNPGFIPHQLFSDTEVLAAAQASEITLTFTGEVYYCPVIGQKPR